MPAAVAVVRPPAAADPVSYTHLSEERRNRNHEAHRRKGCGGEGSVSDRGDAHRPGTVSYTHLENENVLYSDMILKRFAILEERSRSMIEDIQVLREEVIQLKEGYQAQRDLKMNRTMQFLTVVTTIFMPLTLLAGWYGMNFNMPEYDSPFGYPILIIISILLITAGILICKKKKWL